MGIQYETSFLPRIVFVSEGTPSTGLLLQIYPGHSSNFKRILRLSFQILRFNICSSPNFRTRPVYRNWMFEVRETSLRTYLFWTSLREILSRDPVSSGRTYLHFHHNHYGWKVLIILLIVYTFLSWIFYIVKVEYIYYNKYNNNNNRNNNLIRTFW